MPYADIQFTKAAEIQPGMGVASRKGAEALADLGAKGMVNRPGISGGSNS